jgi:hypothetical protein
MARAGPTGRECAGHDLAQETALSHSKSEVCASIHGEGLIKELKPAPDKTDSYASMCAQEMFP